MSMYSKEYRAVCPDYSALHPWQKYGSALETEYRQCLEEGLDIERYQALFSAVQGMPDNAYREEAADVLYRMIEELPAVPGYPYEEPSDYQGIAACRDGFTLPGETPRGEKLREQIAGAWYGRIAGCLLGKPLEGIRREELLPFLKETGNWPMHRYVLSSDITEERLGRYQYSFWAKAYADTISEAPVDDDTNYTVLYQQVIEKYSKDFTPRDVAEAWLAMQPKDAYCTAERAAFCNFVNGYLPPYSAIYKNPYREWIGAQIRGDYFGYINPGDPEKAAEMAWRDASISHVKNGIYGEMFAAAMIASAACSKDIPAVIRSGLSQIPQKSRLYEEISEMLQDYEAGVGKEEAFAKIFTQYDDRRGHDWCHTISNARIVAGALLYGGGDFGKSICMAVETGFDTDCNGATVGSALGMMNGIGSIPSCWTDPLHDKLDTEIFGVGTVEIPALIEMTLRHIGR